MKPPSSFERQLGRRGNATTVALLAAAAIVGWWVGAVPWWLALGMVVMAGPVRRAGLKVRAYDAWRAQWQAMAGYEVKPKRKRRFPRLWQQVVCALVFAVGLPYVPGPPGSRIAVMESWLWMAAWLYVACVLVWFILRLARRRGKVGAKTTKEKDGPVYCLLPLPSSSPSRAEAVRNLPDYCAGLIAGNRRVTQCRE
jgi:hypothetical protein